MNAVPRRYEDLSGTDKAAALLMSLPAEQSASVLRHLQDIQIERITTKMLHHDQISPEMQDQVLREANDLAIAQRYLAAGGVEYARGILSDALGKERAEELIGRLLAKMQSQPFHYLDDVDPAQIAMFLGNQHPQIIALILSHLRDAHCAAILALLPQRLQPQVSLRLASMDSINPAVITQVETAFKKKLSSVLDSETRRSKIGGLEYLVRVLRLVDRSTERSIISELDDSAPELSADIKRQMFVFENLTLLDDRAVQRVLREVDMRDLALAMRNTTEALRMHVFNNMSQRAAAMVREEIDMSPPVRVRTIEEAQQRIVEVVRRLEDADEIVVSRGGADVLL